MTRLSCVLFCALVAAALASSAPRPLLGGILAVLGIVVIGPWWSGEKRVAASLLPSRSATPDPEREA